MRLYFLLLLLFLKGTNNSFHNFWLPTISVNVSETAIIQCGHRDQSITVILTKDGKDITNDERVTYDYAIGFSIKNVTFEDQGDYICWADGDELFQEVKINRRKILPRPSIDRGKNEYFVKGDNFSLVCLLIDDDNIVFEWKYPNHKVNHTSWRDELQQNSTRYQKNTLQIVNASNDDTGNYTCVISDPENSTLNSDSIYIQVEESKAPCVEINTNQKINTIEGTPYVEWRSEVWFYPPPPSIKYTNWRGEEVDNATDRISIFFKANSEAWLNITDISSNDFGNYTISVITGDGAAQNSSTVFLEVESAPLVNITSLPQVVRRGEKLNITCSVQGFPLANINFLYQSCLNTDESSCNSISPLNLNGKSDYPAPGNIAVKSVFFSPTASGLLYCYANNSKETKNETTAIRISDIGYDFILEFGIDKIENNKSITIVENDNFFLKCAGIKYNYKNVTLAVYLQPGFSVEPLKNNSEFSWITSIEYTKATKAFSGNYTCTAYPFKFQSITRRSIAINVIEEEMVRFRKGTNMKNETKEVKLNKPFTLRCNVSGTPPPTIKWMKDKKNLTTKSTFFYNDSMQFSNNFMELTFKFVDTNHTGMYTCIAENRLNRVMTSFALKLSVPDKNQTVIIVLIISILGLMIFIIVIIYLMKRVRKEQRLRKSYKEHERDLFEKGNIKLLNSACTADKQADMLPYDKMKWEIPRENITPGKQLGSGAFGRVLKAKVSGLEGPGTTTVAIKMCRDFNDTTQMHALISELKIMMHLGKHLNIVNLMGASTVQLTAGEVWMVVEYCRFGNLLDFMQRHRRKFTNQICPSTGKIICHIDLKSPLSPALSECYPRTPCDQDDYLTPNGPKFKLSDSPLAHSGGTTCSSSKSTSSIQCGPVNQVANNPMYAMNIADKARTEDSKTGHKGKDEINESRIFQRKDSMALSDRSSVSQQLKDLDTSSIPLMEQSTSQPPLSPTDTHFAGENPVDFVLRSGNIPGINATFCTSDLICWGWQMAQGMKYLSERKILHGDLAARNLLLADKNVVKISDFGLSRNMYKNNDYIKKGGDLLPIKWMSIEAINDRIFSIESDVWAFGITLWEIFSLGSTPYPGVEIGPDFMDQLENGYRMSCPKYANEEIYQIMKDCWKECPQERPSFSHLVEQLGDMISELTEEYLSQNEMYMQMNEERFREETDYLTMMANPSFENWTKPEDFNDQLDETNNPTITIIPSLESTNMNSCERYDNVENQTGKSNSNGCEFSHTVAGSAASPSSFSNVSPIGSTYLPMDSCKSPNASNDIVCSTQNETSRFVFPSNVPEESRLSTQEQEKNSLLKYEEHSEISATTEPSVRENLSLEKENNLIENENTIDSNYVNL